MARRTGRSYNPYYPTSRSRIEASLMSGKLGRRPSIFSFSSTATSISRTLIRSLSNSDAARVRAVTFLVSRLFHAERRRKADGPSHKRSSRPASSNAGRKAVPREERHRSNRQDEIHAATRPAPRSPATPSRVVGPRPPTSPAPGLVPHGDAASPRTPAHLENTPATTVTPDPRLPKITLQRPTPQPDSPAPAGLGLSMAEGPPQSPSPNPASPLHSSPPLGAINVPQVQDAALQKFFHDIAEQLQLIGSASPRSSIAMDSPMQSPALSHAGTTALPTPLTTPIETEAPVLPVIQRPKPLRASTDQPVATTHPKNSKRRSYLGDAPARDNVVASFLQSAPVQSEKARNPTPTSTDSKRKSRRMSDYPVQADRS